MQVHPRLRGELSIDRGCRVGVAGSSPLTRGTQRRAVRMEASVRFIPAYAGNSA